jgi:hypothetical protein
MNKIYLIAPLVGMIAFGAYFYSFNSEYQAKQAAIKAEAAAKVKAKQEAEIKAREQAIKDAIETAAKRKKEREEKEAAEELKKKQRQELEDKRQLAFEERRKLRDQVERLKKDVQAVKDEIAKIEEERKRHLGEQDFLRTYVKQATANQKYYYDLLDKIAAAEKAKAEADAAAAKAAKG